jgi:hypothetical protein
MKVIAVLKGITELAGAAAPFFPAPARVFESRFDVSFTKYNGRIDRKFLVCGTSLQPVVENVAKRLAGREDLDYRILFPDFNEGTASRAQLKSYNGKGNAADQVALARGAYHTLYNALYSKNGPPKNHLRLYQGIMFHNITVIDYTAFYDMRGAGNENITIRCRRPANKKLAAKMEALFDAAWSAAAGNTPPPKPEQTQEENAEAAAAVCPVREPSGL